ncbi:hypothetical protein LUZ60_007469 [Juncus effusus]|nr:hypothetical protein LUZ60_007469 [Juncus effusus]
MDRIEMFQEENEKIMKSKSILIIGGGPVGVELAAEIAMDYPDKRISLVHSGPRLLEFISPKASSKASEWLSSRKIRVLLNQSIDLENISESDRVYKTSAGETIFADTYFDCTGKQIGSEWLGNSILKEYLNENGRVMVDENLRVGGLKNIFAIGDITDTQECKQGELAQKHATLVAKNLKMLIKHGSNSKEQKLLKYKPATSASAMVTLGRRDALADYPFMTIAGLIPGMVKSRDLCVGRTRKLMGLDIFK